MALAAQQQEQADAYCVSVCVDVERRQHVHELTHRVLAGCRQAGQPFTWVRAAGLRAITAALAAGLQDSDALEAALEASYSQLLEVLLSTLDRDLIPEQQPAPGGTSGDGSSSSSSLGVQELLAAVGRCPAGFAPAAASTEELQEAFRVLQAVCLLHAKARALLCQPQYIQLATARACEAPGCLPAAMDALLALLQGNEEAQAMFVTAGSLDMLLARTLEHVHAASSTGAQQQQQQQGASSGSSQPKQQQQQPGVPPAGRELLMQLLVFVQLLQWVLARQERPADETGACDAHAAAAALLERHLGQQATSTLLTQDTPAAAGDVPAEGVLRQRASEAAAALRS